MAKIQFTDNSVKVKEALEDAVLNYLDEAAGELLKKTKSNTRQGAKYKGKEATSLWKYVVDEGEKVATIGSPDEAAYWEELGTGEYALNKDGRKGWWVYVEGNDTPRANQKKYTKEEALQTAAFLRSKGLDAHATNGIKPNRPLHRAFTSMKGALIRRAEEVLGARMK